MNTSPSPSPRTFVIRSLTLVCLFSLTALVAGCGSDKESPSNTPASVEAPDAQQILTDTARALDEFSQKPPAEQSVQLGLDLDVQFTPGPELDQQLASQPAIAKRIVETGIVASLNGGFSNQATNLEASLTAGDTYDVKYVGDSAESFTYLFDSWYGPGKGIEAIKQKAGDTQNQTSEAELRKLLRQAPGLFQAESSVGPELDGVETWQVTATLDPQKAAELAAKQGEAMSAEDRKILDQFAQDFEFILAVGRDDSLPRQAEIKGSLDTAKYVAATEGTQDGSTEQAQEAAKAIKSIEISFKIDLAKYGEEVVFEKPSNPQPQAELEQRLQQEMMKLLFGGAAGGIQEGGTMPPSSSPETPPITVP